MILENIRKDFSDLNEKIAFLENIDVDFYFDGNLQNDFSILKNTFSKESIEYFLRRIIIFTEFPKTRVKVEIKMISNAYKFFLFDGLTFRQSEIFFYTNTNLED